MSEPLIVAMTTGGLTLIGTIFTVFAGNRKNEQNLNTSLKVMETKIEELTREVRAHNNFAQRMPVVEEKIKTLDYRLANLERR